MGSPYTDLTVLRDEGLILVPHLARGRGPDGCALSSTGVRLVDWLDDELIARGVASAPVLYSRPVPLGEHLLLLSGYAVESLDVSDAEAPALLGSAELPFGSPFPLTEYLVSHLGRPRTFALVGTTLVVRAPVLVEEQGRQVSRERIHLVDLSDPSEIRVGAHLDLPSDTNARPFMVAAGRVYTHHAEPLAGRQEERLVRFYLGEWDVSDPAQPRRLRSVNIPGVPVHIDAATGRLVTVDFQWEQAELAPDQRCRTLDKVYEEAREDAEGTRRVLVRSVDLVVLGEPAVATRAGRIPGLGSSSCPRPTGTSWGATARWPTTCSGWAATTRRTARPAARCSVSPSAARG